ncbi:ABC transporter permease [Jiangella aurantiaca]|uniref:ABC transporter permease n=1 Tax=Jiangella aurantiaca TaxID=2530373 RepID=A0A4R5A1L2_9ACTN|nr:ABC transporter permease [Jiangella aurantiaca]TDD64656.1 ABC transporter permease [Jiangella aurantiaca]
MSDPTSAITTTEPGAPGSPGSPAGIGAGAEAAPSAAKSSTLVGDAWRELRRRPLFIVASLLVILLVVVAIAPQLFSGWFGNGDPRVCDLSRSIEGPASGHPFGFDKQGCDVYANVVYGARASISVGVLVTALTLVLSLVLGSLAGFFGRAVDAVVSRFADVFFGFPFLLGALVVLTAFEARSIWVVALVLAVFRWPSMTRVMRSSVIQVRDMDYVRASVGLGGSKFWLLRRHVLPNAMTPIMVMVTLDIGTVIVVESTLTFLGVGLQAPAISWGLQLSNASTDFAAAPHLLIFPSLFLSLTVLSFIVLGDLIRDALDPRLR